MRQSAVFVGARLALAVLVTFVSSPAIAGIAVSAAEEARPSDPTGLEALALLPPESRAVLLEAAVETELLASLADLQRQSGERFGVVLSGFTPEQQILAWQIVGFPELVDALLSARSVEEVESILAEHGGALAFAAGELATTERAVLRAVALLRDQTEHEFELLVGDRALGVQATFRALVMDSNALALLDRDPEFVASVGALYRRDPAATLRALDDLADEALARYASVLPGWEGEREDEEPPSVPPAGGAEGVVAASTAVDAAVPHAGGDAVEPAAIPISIWLSTTRVAPPVRSSTVYYVSSSQRGAPGSAYRASGGPGRRVRSIGTGRAPRSGSRYAVHRSGRGHPGILADAAGDRRAPRMSGRAGSGGRKLRAGTHRGGRSNVRSGGSRRYTGRAGSIRGRP